jgi:hypothetical protein
MYADSRGWLAAMNSFRSYNNGGKNHLQDASKKLFFWLDFEKFLSSMLCLADVVFGDDRMSGILS